MVAVTLGRDWHVSWWEWHVLMLAAFVVVAVSAQRSWREERWVGLYLPDTASAQRDVSVVFADLQGFTAFSERHTPQQVSAMLNAYFSEAIPHVVERFGGEIDRLVGDAIMVDLQHPRRPTRPRPTGCRGGARHPGGDRCGGSRTSGMAPLPGRGQHR